MSAEAAAIVMVYVTCADAAEARRIGAALVGERLAACVNLRPHETIYRWRGVVEQGNEYALLAKTTRARYPALESRIRALHSYELPCIVALPLAAGLGPYLDWIAAESAAERDGASGSSSRSSSGSGSGAGSV